MYSQCCSHKATHKRRSGAFLQTKPPIHTHARENTQLNIPENDADDGGGDIFVALSSVEERDDGLVLELADLVEKVSDVVVRNQLPAAPTRRITSSAVRGDGFVGGGRGEEKAVSSGRGTAADRRGGGVAVTRLMREAGRQQGGWASRTWRRPAAARSRAARSSNVWLT